MPRLAQHSPRATARAAHDGKVVVDPPTRTVQRVLIVSPVILLVGMYVVFGLPAESTRHALLRGYLVYWLACGLALPLLLVGPRRVITALLLPAIPGRRLSWRAATLLALPPFVSLFLFPSLFSGDSGTIFVGLVAYAIVNGVLEELYWRGLFVQYFPDDVRRGLLYPAVMYAAWLVLALSASGPWSLLDAVVMTGAGLASGLLYGWVAWHTGSIRWTIVSHVLMNVGGIGALTLLGR